jgi:hypothetical protein
MLQRGLTEERIVGMGTSRWSGLIGVIVADAVLILLAALFLYFPKALPMPNLDIISMVLALVAVALTIVGFGVIGLNKSVDQNAG